MLFNCLEGDEFDKHQRWWFLIPPVNWSLIWSFDNYQQRPQSLYSALRFKKAVIVIPCDKPNVYNLFRGPIMITL